MAAAITGLLLVEVAAVDLDVAAAQAVNGDNKGSSINAGATTPGSGGPSSGGSPASSGSGSGSPSRGGRPRASSWSSPCRWTKVPPEGAAMQLISQEPIGGQMPTFSGNEAAIAENGL